MTTINHYKVGVDNYFLKIIYNIYKRTSKNYGSTNPLPRCKYISKYDNRSQYREELPSRGYHRARKWPKLGNLAIIIKKLLNFNFTSHFKIIYIASIIHISPAEILNCSLVCTYKITRPDC